jgi:hypothetical protein
MALTDESRWRESNVPTTANAAGPPGSRDTGTVRVYVAAAGTEVPLCSAWGFALAGRAYEPQYSFLCGPDPTEVRACCGEAQRVVRSTSDLVGVVVVLAVVFPEAHGADVVAPSVRQRQRATAGAGIRPAAARTDHVHECHRDIVASAGTSRTASMSSTTVADQAMCGR